MSKYSANFDRDLTTLLKYLGRTLGSKDAVRQFLDTPSDQYFGMTPVQLMASTGDAGPRMILQNLVCDVFSSKLAA